MGWYGKYTGEVIRIKPEHGKWEDKPPKYQLSPCQKCGATQDNKDICSNYYGFLKGKDGWFIKCKKCGNSTDYFRNEIDAVNAWNGDDAFLNGRRST